MEKLNRMRFGAPLFGTWRNPEEWIATLKRKGYDAAYNPLGLDAPEAEIAEYKAAAEENDIVIAEVGAWANNPLHPDKTVAEAGFQGLVKALRFADSIGALCCVNVAGSLSERWDGHHPENLTQRTFERIVGYITRLLDEVQPAHTAFALEMMPWMFPTTADEMLKLIDAVGRPGFAAHVDLVNVTCSPRLYYENAQMTLECFAALGSRIRSVHAKDILLGEELTVHLSEVRPGLGGFDYRALLSAVRQHCPDAPVMLEHLSTEQDYDLAAEYVRGVATSLGISVPQREE